MIRLAESLPVENVTIIVGSLSIVQNQAKEVLDAADDFKSKNTIDNVHNESTDAQVLEV